MDQSEGNIDTARCTTQVYPAPNPPTRELDNDERTTSQRIAETFESVRRDMATAWNKAMIHIDDEVVFEKTQRDDVGHQSGSRQIHPSCVESQQKGSCKTEQPKSRLRIRIYD